ncbi:MAG TPA: hypothetical protein VGB52_01630 [Actinomycetota bacterium]
MAVRHSRTFRIALTCSVLLALCIQATAWAAPGGNGKGGGGNSSSTCRGKRCSDPEPSPDPSTEPSPSPSPTATTEPSPTPTLDTEGSFTVTDLALTNTAVSDDLAPLGRARMAERGSLSLMLYETRFGHEPWLFARDRSSGTANHIKLPYDSLLGWTDASYVLTPSDDLWIFSGSGPMYMRRFKLSGSPPSSASFVSTTTFGDSESRPGNMIQLAGGGLVAVWHRQSTTAQHGIAYRAPSSSSWQTMTFSFIPTRASKDILVQHPADGSIWLFNSPDAWSSIGAAHLTETTSGLRLDWSEAAFIDSRYGEFDADPENPDLAAAADPSTGEIVLAYQSAKRTIFGGTVAGSYPAVARILPDGGKSFVHLPIYVERISRLGLVVRPGSVWLIHRPIDTADLSFDDLYISRLSSGSWSTKLLGSVFAMYERVGYGISRVEFSARLSDGRIHTFDV